MSDGSKNMLLDVAKLSPEHAVPKLIDHAVTLGASDLFFVSNEQHVAVQVRHLGLVRLIAILSAEQGRKSLSHIKANAGIDLQTRQPSDGRWIYRFGDNGTIDLRINTIPTLYGEDFSIRLLNRASTLYSLDKLGMTYQQQQQYQQMIASPSGLVLITGPTGSGKTATLYASLMKLNDGHRKINTIEDPVEYAVDGLRQSQVNPAINLGFSTLLRSILRQSPDVIMIGEIRDAETAQTAVHAANSGMLVLATLHAPSAAGAVQSLRSLNVNPHFLANSLKGVVSQRLVRELDPATKKVASAVDDGFDPFEEVRRMLKPDEGKALYGPVAAESNQMTGYTGRVGVFEVMVISKELRNMIADGASTRDLRNKAIEQGMLTFRQAALLKIARGHTTSEELFRVIPTEQLNEED